MPILSRLWRKHRHIAPPGTLGVATSSFNSGKCGVKGTQATYCALVFVTPYPPPPARHSQRTAPQATRLAQPNYQCDSLLMGTNDSAEIEVPETDRRRLEKQLEHDHGGRVQPVWLSDETDSEGVAHLVIGQLQRFGAPDAYAFITGVVLWGPKALAFHSTVRRPTSVSRPQVIPQQTV